MGEHEESSLRLVAEGSTFDGDGPAEAESTETQEPSAVEYSWPVISFDTPPYRTYHFYRQFRSSSNPNNFFKGVKWSPDGSSFLTSSDDKTLRLFALAEGGGSNNIDLGSVADGEDSYTSNLLITEGESVYDCCWYPYMNASDVASCVFATTTRDHPIHVWDATTGELSMFTDDLYYKTYPYGVLLSFMVPLYIDCYAVEIAIHINPQLRCTYRAYDQMDEITAAISIGFSPSGTKIFAGYNKTVRAFDVHRPGRDFAQYSTLQGNKEGQSGIISAISFSPAHSGLLAAGCYDQTTALYREDNMELLYILHGQEGGVTHVQFSKDGNYLYTGARKDPYILCWDVRNTVETVYKLYRSTEQTNQKIAFDVDPVGQHLGTGGQDGLVHIYDLQTGQWKSSFQAASDTVSGFAFHPYLPMAVTASGHRRYVGPDESDEDFSISGNENCASVWSFPYIYKSVDENTQSDPGEDSGDKNT